VTDALGIASVPLVTIVIPVWDQHTPLLARCVAAIEHEHVQPEIVVVDNHSSEPIDIPPRCHRVTLPTRHSIGAARNAGLEHVTTRYVVFADADDEVAPTSLRRGFALMQRAPQAVGVIGRSIVDEHGRTRRGRTPRRAYQLSSRWLPSLTPLLWLTAFQASITSTVLSTACVRDVGGFADADMGEDWRLAARLARRGPFICIDEAVRIYHRHQAATRIIHQPDTDHDATQRAIWADCIADPHATRSQRLLASAFQRLAHRSLSRFEPR
jgi:glycosyltransferase involved in cell wall biosynthesis